jgi:type I restriction enzyme S subunit
MASLNTKILNNVKVVLPIPPEQRAIAGALSDVDGLIGALDQLIAKKRDLKQAAMQQLLTGQIRLPGFHGEWEVKRLDNFAPLQRGFDLPTPQIRPGDYPVVYSNGVLNHHAQFMVEAPGVVTGRSGTIGNVHFLEENFWPHNTSLWVTDFKGNHPKFVYYLLTSLGLRRFSTGSGVPTLNRNDVHEFRVSVPPSSAEQTAIAEVLSDMDAELAALTQRRGKTRALKQGMMQELLTGRIRLV